MSSRLEKEAYDEKLAADLLKASNEYEAYLRHKYRNDEINDPLKYHVTGAPTNARTDVALEMRLGAAMVTGAKEIFERVAKGGRGSHEKLGPIFDSLAFISEDYRQMPAKVHMTLQHNLPIFKRRELVV